MSGRKRKGDGDQSQATLFSCWSAAKRSCSQETEPLQSHIIMDEPENFVPPETSGKSTSVAAPILDEAEDDVKEGPLSILHEQASGQPVSEWSIFSKNIENFRNRGRCPPTPAGALPLDPAGVTPGPYPRTPNSNPLRTVLATRVHHNYHCRFHVIDLVCTI